MLPSEKLLEKVEQLRTEKGLTFANFIKKAGISHGTLYSWKTRGTYPRVDVLEGIADALEIPLAELLFDVDKNNLPADEIELLSEWRQLDERQKKAIIMTMKSMCIQ